MPTLGNCFGIQCPTHHVGKGGITRLLGKLQGQLFDGRHFPLYIECTWRANFSFSDKFFCFFARQSRIQDRQRHSAQPLAVVVQRELTIDKNEACYPQNSGDNALNETFSESVL